MPTTLRCSVVLTTLDGCHVNKANDGCCANKILGVVLKELGVVITTPVCMGPYADLCRATVRMYSVHTYVT